MDWTDKDDKDAAESSDENVVVHTAYVSVQRHTSVVLSRRSYYNSLNVTTCVSTRLILMLMLVGLPQSQVNAVALRRHHRLAITLD